MQTDGFLKPREQRRRASRQNKRSDRQPVFGSGDVVTLKAGIRTPEYYIFNLDGETTEGELSKYLKDNSMRTHEVEGRSNDNATNRSMGVVIDSDAAESIRKPDLWPRNVGVRPYYNKRNTSRVSKD